MQINYCGAVWTIVTILAGAGLKSGYEYVLRNDHGEEVVASAEELGSVF